jgi:hypothetical protein
MTPLEYEIRNAMEDFISDILSCEGELFSMIEEGVQEGLTLEEIVEAFSAQYIDTDSFYETISDAVLEATNDLNIEVSVSWLKDR